MAVSGAFISRIREELARPAARIAALAVKQHGVVCRPQLLALGVPSATIARSVVDGRLHEIRRGVYAVGHLNLTREGRWMAALLAAGEDAALSHVAAARFNGVDSTKGVGPIHITIPRHRHSAPPGVVIHRPCKLDRRDLLIRSRIPATTATRTIFDLATMLSPEDLRERFERAEYLETLDYARLRALISESPHHGGNGVLRALLDMPYVPLSRTRSKLERIVLRVCRDHHLPAPGVNVPLLGYEVDFHWPEARFIVEVDGGHHAGERRDRDNARDVAVSRAGQLVRRYGEEPLRDEEGVGAEILEILLERLPPGLGPA